MVASRDVAHDIHRPVDGTDQSVQRRAHPLQRRAHAAGGDCLLIAKVPTPRLEAGASVGFRWRRGRAAYGAGLRTQRARGVPCSTPPSSASSNLAASATLLPFLLS